MTVRKRQPIRVFYSPLSNRFYATRRWREDEKKGQVIVTGEKFDVTNDIASAVVEHKIEFAPLEPEPEKA